MWAKVACQKGGWARARQHANIRRANPSNAERQAQEALAEAFPGAVIEPEYEIHNGQYPQWIDILLTVAGQRIAIEVDGSHGWHNTSPDARGKMGQYDLDKAAWCKRNGLPLVRVKKGQIGKLPKMIEAIIPQK